MTNPRERKPSQRPAVSRGDRPRAGAERAALVIALALAATASFGWYRARAAAEKERTEQLSRLLSSEQNNAEMRHHLEECKAWMDALMSQAAAADSARPPPTAAPIPSAPASTESAASAQGVASAVQSDDDTRLVQRRRRMLELRGQLNGAVELRSASPPAPAGTP